MAESIKVFISHATEDKERFVVNFAKRLRASGLEAWLDKWEIQPGDSLVDKVFANGIEGAQHFVVVLSAVAVTKPWVKEEIDAAFVRRIGRQCRIIPLLLDDCAVPESLKHLLWVRIKNLDNYDDEFASIVAVMYGQVNKPPLGTPPGYASGQALFSLPGLTSTDSHVLEVVCKLAMSNNSRILDATAVLAELSKSGITKEMATEVLEVLEGRGHVELESAMGGGIFLVRLGLVTYDDYLRVSLSNYKEMVVNVASAIVNNKSKNSGEVQSATGLPAGIVSHCLDMLESNNLIGVAHVIGGYTLITRVSAEMRRMLQ